MTRDEIIVMAGKAGLPILWITETGVIKWTDLERFASLVAEAERLRLSDKFMQMHKKEQDAHNYWLNAAYKILEEPEHNHGKEST